MKVLLAMGATLLVAYVVGVVMSGDAGMGRPSSRPHHTATAKLPGDAAEVQVVRIVDGDTLVVRSDTGVRGLVKAGETTVRLLEIDTPESVQPGMPVECYAKQATTELTRLAPPGSTVRVLRDRDLLDPYGRTLLYLWNGSGEFVNLELVRSGAARAVLYEPNDRYIELMRGAEAGARAADAGLWSRC